MVRVPGGAVTGAALALWNRRQREATPEIEMGRPEVQGALGPRVEGKKEDEKQVGAEGRMDSQSVQRGGWTPRVFRGQNCSGQTGAYGPTFLGIIGNNHSGV